MRNVNTKNNQHGFSIIFTLLIVLIVAIVAGLGWYVYQQHPEALKDSKQNGSVIVPERVSLFLDNLPLRPIRDDEPRKPWLNLQTFIGSGCADNVDLETSKIQLDESLAIDIKGYVFTGDDTACTAMTEARANIEIDLNWLTDGSQKDLTINLSSQKNTYILTRNENQITLTPQKATNVISHKSGYNQPNTAEVLDITL